MIRVLVTTKASILLFVLLRILRGINCIIRFKKQKNKKINGVKCNYIDFCETEALR